MKKLSFFTSVFICIWANFSLSINHAWADKTNKQIKLVKLDNLNDSSLEVFLNDDDLIQNISTKNAELNLSFDASSLIKDTLLPTSFKIEIYDVTTNKRLLGVVRPSILNERRVRNFKINIELVNLTKSSNLEINIYNAKNDLFGSYNANIVIENQSGISFTELEAADCTEEFGKCQLEYIFQNIHFTTLPSKGLKTKVEQNTDGTYSVNLPLIRGKKNIRVKNIFGGSNGDSGSSDNQDFSFDFDGSNLFVIKDGVTTQVSAQGPAGAKGETGAPGGFTGRDVDINGTLTFVTGGKLQDAILNGTSLVTTNTPGEIPLVIKGATTQTANLIQVQNSTGTPLVSISSDGNLTAAGGTFSNNLTTNGTTSSALTTTTSTGSVESGVWSSSGINLLRPGNNIGSLFGTASAHGIDFVTNGYTRMSISDAGSISFFENFTLGTSTSGRVFYQNAPSGWGDSYLVQRAGTSRGGIGGLSGDDGVALFSGVNYTSGTPAVRVSTNRVDIVNVPLIISGQGAAATGLTVRGATAQTANLQEWQDNSSTIVASVSANGISTATYFRTPNKASGVSFVPFRIYDEYGAIHGIGLDLNNQLYTTSALGVNGSAPGGHKLSVTGVTSINLSGGDYFGVGNSGDGYAAFKVVGTTNFVGIGTQSPTERLEVQGNVKVNGGLTSSQDIEITDPTRGIILRSPNGTRWRIQVNDAGTLTTTSL